MKQITAEVANAIFHALYEIGNPALDSEIRDFVHVLNRQGYDVSSLQGETEQLSVKLRESVQWFAQQMELKLRENDHKGGWSDHDFYSLFTRLKQEAQELETCPNSEDIREAADVANFAMMIADNARRKAPELSQAEEPKPKDKFWVMQDLLKEAKEKYPAGTKVKIINGHDTFFIGENRPWVSGEVIYGVSSINRGEFLYYKDQWAEIVEPAKAASPDTGTQLKPEIVTIGDKNETKTDTGTQREISISGLDKIYEDYYRNKINGWEKKALVQSDIRSLLSEKQNRIEELEEEVKAAWQSGEGWRKSQQTLLFNTKTEVFELQAKVKELESQLHNEIKERDDKISELEAEKKEHAKWLRGLIETAKDGIKWSERAGAHQEFISESKDEIRQAKAYLASLTSNTEQK
jgi:hypothetical protein